MSKGEGSADKRKSGRALGDRAGVSESLVERLTGGWAREVGRRGTSVSSVPCRTRDPRYVLTSLRGV